MLRVSMVPADVLAAIASKTDSLAGPCSWEVAAKNRVPRYVSLVPRTRLPDAIWNTMPADVTIKTVTASLQ